MTDADLLRSYVREGCEKAFEEIARRYTPLVYSTCLRRLGDAHAAEDAAQATFLALARKAGGFGRGVVLAAWLYRAAEVSAQTHARTERRRARREREAARMRESSGSNRGAEGWESLRARRSQPPSQRPSRSCYPQEDERKEIGMSAEPFPSHPLQVLAPLFAAVLLWHGVSPTGAGCRSLRRLGQS